MTQDRSVHDATYRVKNRDARRAIVDRLLGDSCVICSGCLNLAVHRKDGTKHEKLQWKSAGWVERELSTDKYVRLCYPCHKGVHWAMEHLGYTWEAIAAKVS